MSFEAPRFRWWLAWTLFLSTAINYIHRQTLSVLAPVITREFHLSATDYAWIVSALALCRCWGRPACCC